MFSDFFFRNDHAPSPFAKRDDVPLSIVPCVNCGCTIDEHAQTTRKRPRNVSYVALLDASKDSDAPPKIPIVGDGDVEGLDASPFLEVIDYNAGAFCEKELHRAVKQWLMPFKIAGVGGGEANLHSLYDPIYNIICEITGGVLIRDAHDSLSKASLRPDVVVTCGVPFLRAE